MDRDRPAKDPFGAAKDPFAAPPAAAKDPFGGAPARSAPNLAERARDAPNPFKNRHPWKEDEAARAKDPFGSSAVSSGGGAAKDPFGASPAGALAAELGLQAPAGPARDAAWQAERQKLDKWEGGKEMATKSASDRLTHLEPFLGPARPEAGPGRSPAEAAVGAAIKGEAVRPARYLVSEPQFDEHDSDMFMCDGCKRDLPRHEFSDEALRLLGDCKEEREKLANKAKHRPKDCDELEGPWRGMMVRLHMNGHGYVSTPELLRKYKHDVYCHAHWVQVLMGGSLGAAIEMQERGLIENGDWASSRQPLCRVQYRLAFASAAIHKNVPDGHMIVQSAEKLFITCKQCERRKAHKEKAQRDLDAAVLQSIKGSGAAGRSNLSMVKPLTKGFDPQQKLTSVIGSMRQKLGLPAPGTPGAIACPSIPGMFAGKQVKDSYGGVLSTSKSKPSLLQQADVALAHAQEITERQRVAPSLSAIAPPPAKRPRPSVPTIEAEPSSRGTAADPFSADVFTGRR